MTNMSRTKLLAQATLMAISLVKTGWLNPIELCAKGRRHYHDTYLISLSPEMIEERNLV